MSTSALSSGLLLPARLATSCSLAALCLSVVSACTAAKCPSTSASRRSSSLWYASTTYVPTCCDERRPPYDTSGDRCNCCTDGDTLSTSVSATSSSSSDTVCCVAPDSSDKSTPVEVGGDEATRPKWMAW